MLDKYLVTLLIFTPLAGSLISLFIRGNAGILRKFTIGVLVLELVWGLLLLSAYQTANPSLQLTQTTDWITLDLGSLGRVSIDYAVGVDGLNLALTLLAEIGRASCRESVWLRRVAES